jgi:hypothetical protein
MGCSKAFGFLSKGSRDVIPGEVVGTILFPKIKRAIRLLADHPFFEIYGLNSFSV